MLKNTLFGLLFVLLLLQSCNNSVNTAQLVLPSPKAAIHVYFNLNEGEPYYKVYFRNKMIVDWSLLGIVLHEDVNFANGLAMVSSNSTSVNSEKVMELVGGLSIIEKYNELVVKLKKQDNSQQMLDIRFRAYDDGVAIGYQFEKNDQPALINMEETQLDLAGAEPVWKFLYKTDSVSFKLPLDSLKEYELPASFISSEGLNVTITESFDSIFPPIILKKRTEANPEFTLTPFRKGSKANMPVDQDFCTPWRLILISEIKD